MRKSFYLALIALAIVCLFAAALATVRQPAEFAAELVDLGSERILLAAVGALFAMLLAAALGDRSVRAMVVGLIRAIAGNGKPASTLFRIGAALILFVVAAIVVISAASKALVSDVGATETPHAVDIAGQRSPVDAFEQFYSVLWGHPDYRQPIHTLDSASYEELLDRVVGLPLTDSELALVLAHPAVITPTTVITHPRALIDEIRASRKYRVEATHEPRIQNSVAVGDLVVLQVALPQRSVFNGGEMHLPAGSAYVVVRRVECDACGGQGWHHFVVAALLIV